MEFQNIPLTMRSLRQQNAVSSNFFSGRFRKNHDFHHASISVTSIFSPDDSENVEDAKMISNSLLRCRFWSNFGRFSELEDKMNIREDFIDFLIFSGYRITQID